MSVLEGGYNVKAGSLSPFAQSVAYHVRGFVQTPPKLNLRGAKLLDEQLSLEQQQQQQEGAIDDSGSDYILATGGPRCLDEEDIMIEAVDHQDKSDSAAGVYDTDRHSSNNHNLHDDSNDAAVSGVLEAGMAVVASSIGNEGVDNGGLHSVGADGQQQSGDNDTVALVDDINNRVAGVKRRPVESATTFTGNLQSSTEATTFEDSTRRKRRKRQAAIKCMETITMKQQAQIVAEEGLSRDERNNESGSSATDCTASSSSGNCAASPES